MGLKKRIDPPRSFTPEEAQQWYKLHELIERELGLTGLSNTLFVDQVAGDNDTAERGSLVFKYATIQAALNAAQAGDTIWVTPGTYVEDLVWPDTDNLTLRGTSKTSTSIENVTATHTITIAPTVEVQLATIMGIAISNTGANRAVSVDGAADPDMFTQGFRMSDCLIFDTVRFASINSYDLRDIEANDGDLGFVTCGGGNVLNSTWNSILNAYAAAAANPPTSGPGILRASGVTTGILSVDGLAKVQFSKDTSVDFILGDLVDTATDVGFIEDMGRITAAITITFDLQNADADIALFDFAKIGGLVSVADAGTPSIFRAAASFRSAELLNQAGPHLAGDLCDMDLRGALFAQNSLAVAGTGAIDRSVWIQELAADTSGDAVDWANGGGAIPYVTAPDSVSVESATIGDLPIAVTAKTAAAVTCVKTAEGGFSIVTAFKDFA